MLRPLLSEVRASHYHNIHFPKKTTPKQKSRRKMARLSGLQRDVLKLYRECFRAIRHKPHVSFFFSSPIFFFPFPKTHNLLLLFMLYRPYLSSLCSASLSILIRKFCFYRDRIPRIISESLSGMCICPFLMAHLCLFDVVSLSFLEKRSERWKGVGCSDGNGVGAFYGCINRCLRCFLT